MLPLPLPLVVVVMVAAVVFVVVWFLGRSPVQATGRDAGLLLSAPGESDVLWVWRLGIHKHVRFRRRKAGRGARCRKAHTHTLSHEGSKVKGNANKKKLCAQLLSYMRGDGTAGSHRGGAGETGEGKT